MRKLLLSLLFVLGLVHPVAAYYGHGGKINLYAIPDWDAKAIAACQKYAPSPNCPNTMVAHAVPNNCINISITTVTTINGGCYKSPNSSTPAIALNSGNNAVIIENATIISTTGAPGIGGFAGNLNITNNDGILTGTNGGFINITCNAGGTCSHSGNRYYGGGIYVQSSATGAVVNSENNVGYNMLGFTGGASHFIQYSNGKFAGSTISGNAALNAPGVTGINDVINLYDAVGTTGSPISVTGNYILGAYPTVPATQGFSGCGIIVDGSSGATASTASQFIEIASNITVDTTNCGQAIAAGHDNYITGGTAVSSGLALGQPVAAQNVGVYVSDQTGQTPSTVFFHNNAYGNNIYWLKATIGSLNNFFGGYTIPTGCDPGYGGGCSNTGISSTTSWPSAISIEAQYVAQYFH